ncbi:MAG TPA: type II toxin-antitoxin system RelE/ParE family toxin [Pyrinomonadaceae bacterium]|nr:type II toxin-antitoxin system RelE/ParE family toxin [Pyrinomonadaceae bacterium]
MAEISWTAEAQTWLRDIYDYIAADNPDAAARTLAGIFLKAQLLKFHPELGHLTSSPDREKSASFITVITD